MKTLLITVLLIVLTTPFYGQTKPSMPYHVNKMLLREKKVNKEEIISIFAKIIEWKGS